MKSKNIFSVVAGWLVMAMAPANAGDAGGPAGLAEAGSIRGRVKDAVSGGYLNNARVSIVGTDIVEFTDATGSYRIANAPAGRVEVEYYFTNMAPERLAIDVPRGGQVERDVSLASKTVERLPDGTLRLDKFVVTAQQETSAQALAVNEQRFAPNIKNVVSTDAFGEIVGGTMGDFLKFMPGVNVEYAGNTVTKVSVRGIGFGMTSMTTDGVPMVSTTTDQSIAAARGFNMGMADSVDVSRIEVTKVPTPSTPADSIGGAVNMISKSAFERNRAELRYSVGLLGSSYGMTLRRTPDAWEDRKTYKVWPILSFDYALPLTENFGIIFGGLGKKQAEPAHTTNETTTYSIAGAGTGASISKPYLSLYRKLGGVRTTEQYSLFTKADWRVTPNAVLSLGMKWTFNERLIGDGAMTFNTGTNGNPTPASGTPLTYAEDFTNGATGRGSVTIDSRFQRIVGENTSPTLSFRFDDGKWKIDSTLNYTRSTRYMRLSKEGPLRIVTAELTVPVRVEFSGINAERPGDIRVFNNSNQPVDFNDINNYRIRAAGTSNQDYERDTRSTFGELKVRRRMLAFPFPSSLEIGGARQIRTYDNEGVVVTPYTYAGPTGTGGPAAPYVAQVFVGEFNAFGGTTPWLSPHRVHAAWQQDPDLFFQTPAQMVTQAQNGIARSSYTEETNSALYLQGEATLLKNRLRVLTGVRFEKTDTAGDGPLFDPNAVFVRNPDETFARNAQGARIRKPEAGAAGSMQELTLTRKRRGFHNERTYDGFFPSLHLTYNINENFLVRTAYAKTFGRPDYGEIIPNITINQTDPDLLDPGDPNQALGTLNATNTGLKPWQADNYDLSLEYYSQNGGIVGAGVFLKEIKDFFSTFQRIATAAELAEFGLSEEYVGWRLNTTINGGDARISGIEFNLSQSLQNLGGWGRYFTVFANATRLKLEGDQQAQFDSFIPKTANWGMFFSKDRFAASAKWNYRGLDKRNPAINLGPDGYTYLKARLSVDVSVAYNLTSRLSLVAAATNVFNAPTSVQLAYGSDTPTYARQIVVNDPGVDFSLTLKGRF